MDQSSNIPYSSKIWLNSLKIYKYKHIFFDLDHTLWDFELNSVETLQDLYQEIGLKERGIDDFNDFNQVYHEINDRLWDRFRKGFLSRQDLRWKRMFQTLVHYKIADEPLAVTMSERYLEILPTKTNVFPHALEVLTFCKEQGYEMHLITNGFEETQKMKLKKALRLRKNIMSVYTSMIIGIWHYNTRLMVLI